MDSSLTRHASEVKGTLSGFDRVRFRGPLRWLANLAGMGVWLGHAGVLLKDFRDYAMGLTDRIKKATNDLAQKAGRSLVYLHSSSLRKEHIARDIAERDGITEGLVCVLTSVEPCVNNQLSFCSAASSVTRSSSSSLASKSPTKSWSS